MAVEQMHCILSILFRSTEARIFDPPLIDEMYVVRANENSVSHLDGPYSRASCSKIPLVRRQYQACKTVIAM